MSVRMMGKSIIVPSPQPELVSISAPTRLLNRPFSRNDDRGEIEVFSDPKGNVHVYQCFKYGEVTHWYRLWSSDDKEGVPASFSNVEQVEGILKKAIDDGLAVLARVIRNPGLVDYERLTVNIVSYRPLPPDHDLDTGGKHEYRADFHLSESGFLNEEGEESVTLSHYFYAEDFKIFSIFKRGER